MLILPGLAILLLVGSALALWGAFSLSAGADRSAEMLLALMEMERRSMKTPTASEKSELVRAAAAVEAALPNKHYVICLFSGDRILYVSNHAAALDTLRDAMRVPATVAAGRSEMVH
jgi:hypothetical protein